MKRKLKMYEDEPESPALTTGCHTAFTEIPNTDKVLKPQIGFIRQKSKKEVKKNEGTRRSRTASKRSNK
jgi:hypothetical protein